MNTSILFGHTGSIVRGELRQDGKAGTSVVDVHAARAVGEVNSSMLTKRATRAVDTGEFLMWRALVAMIRLRRRWSRLLCHLRHLFCCL